MNDLKKMQESCIEFAKVLKTGNVVWEDKRKESKYNCDFMAIIKNTGVFVKIELFGEDDGWFMASFEQASSNVCLPPIELKSTTAKEAAHEALQLVRNEAEKLVELLSEPKKEDVYYPGFWENISKQHQTKEQPFWIPIDPYNIPKGEVIVKKESKFGHTFLQGVLEKGDNWSISCTCFGHYANIHNPTHYHDLSKYPKP